MSVIGDLGNSDGYIYITDYDGTSVISSVINSQNNVRKIISDGVSSYPVASSGSYSSVWGHRYFLNSDPSAQPGVLTSSLEITSFIITQGLQSVRAGVSSTISSGVITPSRVSSIYLLTVDTQGGAGTDDLDTITSTGYYTGDTLYIRGANSSRVVTVKNGTGNIDLANNVDFQTGTVDNILVLQWTGSAWTEVSRSPNPAISVATLRAAGIAEPVQGVNRTTLTNGGGTINLEPGVDKGYQVYDGTVTLAGSYVIQIQPSPSTAYLDGDSMIVDYRALATVGGNTVTIFGIQLTTTQALEGRVILMAKYKLSNTTWYYTILYKAQGVDITNKAYVDATFEPYLGLPASNGYILSSDTSGNRSWIPNPAVGSILTTTLSLTAAQIKAAFASPVVAIPNPGSGLALQIITASSRLTFNSVAYANNNIAHLIATTLIGSGDSQFYDIYAGASYGGSSSKWIQWTATPNSGSSASSIISNDSISFWIEVAAPINGNSTMELYISYQIIPV